MNCQEITTKINEIKTKKAEFDSVEKTDIPKALSLKKELQTIIGQLKEILNPVFKIEGKEFPVFSLEIGGKTAEELKKDLISKNFTLTDEVKEMLHSHGFVTSPTVEQIDLVRLKVSDLGFPNKARIEQIYIKAKELGLELCPAEVGPSQRLKDGRQAFDDWYTIAMEPITDRSGFRFVFVLKHDNRGLWLFSNITGTWSSSRELIFRVPSK